MDFLQVKVLWCLMWFYICQKPLGKSAKLCEADDDHSSCKCPMGFELDKTGFPGYAIAFPPVLLLILLSPVIFKQIIVPFIQYNKKKADTPCRRPVEESGDSSHSSLVKSCQGQP
ncbi:hypothetical protein SKAU_G00172750 [Synaphobranchus kaupii]|uniref:Uncharacterized protein n=1 Tax=Synaphobranchus kaupii TaxID=118154 RepID=A0A9Q1J0V7_SYNKA|nr:hypothetical protein SKAU_G00172750 [Synaphobranchus kaupii]